ncbi:hypothetical protein BurMR1_3696 [Burkholderia sp. MR1]|nr:hypothetical protein BurMR1_3696 [Burkholderia sp. MR1]
MTKKTKAATLAGAARKQSQNGPDFIVKKSAQQSFRDLRQELLDAGIKVNSTESDTQLQRLGAILEYLGSRGLNTYEAEVAGGFARIATRIHDLREEGWEIDAVREKAVGPDGLMHINVARYVLIHRPNQEGDGNPSPKPRRSYRHTANAWDQYRTVRSEWLEIHPGATAAQFDAVLLSHISSMAGNVHEGTIGGVSNV